MASSNTFQINGNNFPPPDVITDANIELMEKDAGRGGNGAMAAIPTINVVYHGKLRWSRMDVQTMRRLSNVLGFNVPNYNEGAFTLFGLAERICIMNIWLPCGFRTIEVYIGSTLKFRPIAKKQSTADLFDNYNDEQVYSEYFEWADVEIDIVGIGARDRTGL